MHERGVLGPRSSPSLAPVEHVGHVPPRSVVIPGSRPKAFAAGTYQVHIGSYNQNDNSPYTLGFTELSSVTAASLAQ